MSKKDVSLPDGLSIPVWEKSDVSSIQALSRGDATPEQQKKALDFIINKVCLTYDMPYRPDSGRDTDFLLGRMFVGQQIVKFIKVNLFNIK